MQLRVDFRDLGICGWESARLAHEARATRMTLPIIVARHTLKIVVFRPHENEGWNRRDYCCSGVCWHNNCRLLYSVPIWCKQVLPPAAAKSVSGGHSWRLQVSFGSRIHFQACLCIIDNRMCGMNWIKHGRTVFESTWVGCDGHRRDGHARAKRATNPQRFPCAMCCYVIWLVHNHHSHLHIV